MGQAARHSMAHCFREAPVTHEGGRVDGVQLHQDGPERADGGDLSEGAVERPFPLETVKGVAHRKLLFELAFAVGGGSWQERWAKALVYDRLLGFEVLEHKVDLALVEKRCPRPPLLTIPIIGGPAGMFLAKGVEGERLEGGETDSHLAINRISFLGQRLVLEDLGQHWTEAALDCQARSFWRRSICAYGL